MKVIAGCAEFCVVGLSVCINDFCNVKCVFAILHSYHNLCVDVFHM